jgi:radical SAM protein with 4Fe4S-binding SPASM domain
MKRNIFEFEKLIEIAHSIGVNKVKLVYFTTFNKEIAHESLINDVSIIKKIFKNAIKIASKLRIELELPYIKGNDPAGDNYHHDCFVGWRDLYIGSDNYIRPCMHTNEKIIFLDLKKNIFDIWNCSSMQQHRLSVNNNYLMNESCKNCYHSSFANWNKSNSLIQTGYEFAPQWNKEK